MKKVLLLSLLACFALTSCKSVHTNAHGDLPPGQAKKITGEKSAKNYAPGQQKNKGKGN
ncbi:MAG TPA: hypothetical protein VLL47_01980 [Robiginitalea sp.]|nr:hypothetical protein [Robiginitalea sp.]